MKYLLILLLSLSLLACTTAPSRPAAEHPEQAWQAHRATLVMLQQWQLVGRLAIQTENEGWHATINWLQQQQEYDIRLIAPLGQGTIQLYGNDKQVVLSSGEGEQTLANDPEALLYQEFGWRVPVASLRYWVLGLPAPGAAQRELDDYGRLTRLFQNNWEIQFHDYEKQGAWELPGRIFINNHRAKVRLVVSRWDLTPAMGTNG